MVDDKSIQDIVREILLKEPKFQHADMIYQSCWRFWEYAITKKAQSKKDKSLGIISLSALSPEAFIDFNVKLGTIESIIRARRKVLKEIGNEDLSRYSQAQKHYQSYLNEPPRKTI